MTRLYILCSELGSVGGVQRLAYLYAKALSLHGDAVTLLHVTGNAPEPLLALPRIDVRRLSVRNVLSLRRSMLRENIPLLILPDSRARLVAASCFSGVRRIFVFDSVRFERLNLSNAKKLVTGLLERWTLARFPVIATFGEVHRRLRQKACLCRGVLYNPIDWPTDHEAEPRPHLRPKVVYLGRLELEKGADRLTDIYQALKKHALGGPAGFDFEIWGAGSLDKKLTAAFRDCESLHKACMMGPTSAPMQVLQTADVLLLPSRTEGPSLTCAEAVSMGVPVVHFAVDGNGPREICGTGGYEVPQGAVDALAHSVCEAVRLPPESRTRIMTESRARYSFAAFVVQLKRLIEP